MANLIIYENGVKRTTPAFHGEEITIETPCDCSAVTGVQIAGVVYPFCDATGKPLPTGTGLFATNNLIRVLIDTKNTRATIINHAINRDTIGAASATVVEDHITNVNNPHSVVANQVPVSESIKNDLNLSNGNVETALASLHSNLESINRALDGEKTTIAWLTYQKGEVHSPASIFLGTGTFYQTYQLVGGGVYDDGTDTYYEYPPDDVLSVQLANSITWDANHEVATMVSPTSFNLKYSNVSSVTAGKYLKYNGVIYKVLNDLTIETGSSQITSMSELGNGRWEQSGTKNYYIKGLFTFVWGDTPTGTVYSENPNDYPDNAWVGDTLYVKVGGTTRVGLDTYKLLRTVTCSSAAQLFNVSLSGINWGDYHKVVVELWYNTVDRNTATIFVNQDQAYGSEKYGSVMVPPTNSTTMTSTMEGLGKIAAFRGSVEFLVNNQASSYISAECRSQGSGHGYNGWNTNLTYSQLTYLSIYCYNNVPVGTTVKIYGVK